MIWLKGWSNWPQLLVLYFWIKSQVTYLFTHLLTDALQLLNSFLQIGSKEIFEVSRISLSIFLHKKIKIVCCLIVLSRHCQNRLSGVYSREDHRERNTRGENWMLCKGQSKESAVFLIILRRFLVIFLTTTFIYFTKLNFRRSFWGAEQV